MKKKTTRTTKKKVLLHEENSAQNLAMWYHLGYAFFASLAVLWHIRCANEHRKEII